jgi:hypothetical protein
MSASNATPPCQAYVALFGLSPVPTIRPYLLTPRHTREVHDVADHLRAPAKADKR